VSIKSVVAHHRQRPPTSHTMIRRTPTGVIYTESGFANYGAMADAFLGSVLPAIPAHRCGTAEEVRTSERVLPPFFAP
jgi:hypothetical protein